MLFRSTVARFLPLWHETIAYRGLMRGQRVVIPGLTNKLATFLIRIVPRRALLAVVDSRQSRRRPAQKS